MPILIGCRQTGKRLRASLAKFIYFAELGRVQLLNPSACIAGLCLGGLKREAGV
ncbi:hypothetical protein [uncultured Erythrobacter sp.]|uniref:hypothetical protein n=1 Tax=uncultured Erythrobacter sp. TaxID=263913 RepID=UPI002602CDC4|nr:hypothetical protein [uncultured Erythrobacter sp.]